jgi:hypothetical protein
MHASSVPVANVSVRAWRAPPALLASARLQLAVQPVARPPVCTNNAVNVVSEVGLFPRSAALPNKQQHRRPWRHSVSLAGRGGPPPLSRPVCVGFPWCVCAFAFSFAVFASVVFVSQSPALPLPAHLVCTHCPRLPVHPGGARCHRRVRGRGQPGQRPAGVHPADRRPRRHSGEQHHGRGVVQVRGHGIAGRGAGEGSRRAPSCVADHFCHPHLRPRCPVAAPAVAAPYSTAPFRLLEGDFVQTFPCPRHPPLSRARRVVCVCVRAQVLVSDGVFQEVCDLRVTVDLSLLAPTFTGPSNFTVPEDAPLGWDVGAVVASRCVPPPPALR